MTSYTNPIIPGFYPDPSICRVGEDYYLVTSSFEYFPGVPVFHSRDLVHWRQIGHCLTRPSQLPLDNARASGGIYAPTLRYLPDQAGSSGTFFMITTNVSEGGIISPGGHFFVTAKDPAGSWSEPIWLEGPGIDPSLFFDEDGKVYFTHNQFEFGPTVVTGIYQRQIDLNTGKPLTELRKIWDGFGGMYPEAPHLYKINGTYYLMCAEGGTEYGHMVTIARSSSPWGPFETYKNNPILTHRSWFSPIQGTGHGDLFQDHRGNWWMVFLAFRPVGYPPCYHLGRETCLAPVTWTTDGWPVVNSNGKVALEMQGPILPTHTWLSEPIRDDFDSPHLRLCWNYLRNPHLEDYSLEERPGWLVLKGTATGLNQNASPTWLGRRQGHFDCHVSALLDFNPQGNNEEAGLVIWMNERHHYEIAITRMEADRCLIVRRRIGRLSAIVASQPIRPGLVTLEISADPNLYHFSYQVGAGPSISLPEADGETRYLSTEVGGMFTGVYFALYATGNGQPCQSPAAFDWFTYAPGSPTG